MVALRDCDPWLAQGDVFASAPVIGAVIGEDGAIVPALSQAPCLLLTQDCELDKQTASGRMRIKTLAFAAIRSASELGPDHLSRLRRGETTPSSVMFVEDVPGFGDGFALLGDTFALPVTYFGAQLREFHAESRLVATSQDTRVGRLADQDRELLNRKQAFYWARLARADDQGIRRQAKD